MPQSKPTTLKLANFPLQLRQAKRWLLWRGDKIPYYTNGRRRGSYGGGLDCEADLSHLVDCKTAYAKLKASNGTYSGLGFALGGGYYGFDFDHVRDPATGEVPGEIAQRINAGIRDGLYVEVSPSGTGLHMIGYWSGELRFRNGKQAEHFEAYHSGRYFTMTGHICAGAAKLRELDPEPALPARAALRLAAEDGRQTVQNDAGGAIGGKVGSGWLADRQTILECLKDLNPDCPREPWRDAGMVIHHTSKGSAEGLAIWEQWSARAAGAVGVKGKPRYVPGHCAEQWSSFGKSDAPPLKLGTLIQMAREARARQRAPDDDVPATAPEVAQLAEAVRQGGPTPFKIISGGALMRTQFPPITPLIDGRLQLTVGAHLLTGKPKRGKSLLAMGLALLACAGKSYLDSKATTPIGALYLACDDPSQGRFTTRMQGMGLTEADTGHFHHVSEIDAAARSSLDILTAIRQAYPAIRFVVIDTLSAFRKMQRGDSPYQQEYDELKAVNDWAHAHGCVVIVVHHLRKGSVDPSDPFESISGTLGLQGAVDGMIVIERKDLDSDFDAALNERLAGLWAKSRDIEEYSFGMKLADLRWSVIGGVADVFSAGTQREIINVLRVQPAGVWMSAKEIHAAGSFDCKPDGVRKACMRMAKKGVIESHHGALSGSSGGGGGYRLPAR